MELKKKIIIGSIILVVSVLLILLQLGAFGRGEAGSVSRGFSGVFNPVQLFFSNIGRSISGTWQSVTKGSSLEEENKQLRQDIYALKEEIERNKQVTEENKSLRKLLDLQSPESGKVIAAEVIARDPDNWFQSIKVNKGFKNGVKPDMTVITSEGIVGRVVSTSEDTANIRLVFSEKSAIPAQVATSGELGVVYGEGKDTCIMKYLNADAKVNAGDLVVTSRLSRIYPPGKIIGQITKVYGRDQVLYQAVQVKPSVQFGNLEYVLITGR